MSNLKIIRVTRHQANLLAGLLLFFSGQRKSAKRRRSAIGNPVEFEQYTHPISITGVYRALSISGCNRPLVKIAANVFFKQKFRGNNLTRRCSGWGIRSSIHINHQLKRLLPELFMNNRDFIFEMNAAVMGKDNTVTVTRVFKFDNDAQAEEFKLLMTELLDEVKNHAE